MKKFKNLLVSLKTRVFKKKRVHTLEVPMVCETRAEKRKILKATRELLEQNILIKL